MHVCWALLSPWSLKIQLRICSEKGEKFNFKHNWTSEKKPKYFEYINHCECEFSIHFMQNEKFTKDIPSFVFQTYFPVIVMSRVNLMHVIIIWVSLKIHRRKVLENCNGLEGAMPSPSVNSFVNNRETKNHPEKTW